MMSCSAQTRFWAILLAVSMWSSACPAQAPDNSRQPESPPSTQQRKTVTIRFPGGNLSEFVNMLRNEDKTIQIAIHPKAAEVKIPEITLEDVRVSDLVSALPRIAESSFPSLGVWSSGTFYVLTTTGNPNPPKSEEKSLSVFQLSQIADNSVAQPVVFGGPVKKVDLTDDKIDDFVKAIEIGLAMAEADEPKPGMKIHKNTKLFFFFGNERQTAVVRQIFNILSTTVPQQPVEAR